MILDFKSKNCKFIIWPYIILLLIHLLLIFNVQQPWFWPDEFIQLGHARFFAGGDHWLFREARPYAHFAYTFLLIPAFWISSEPLVIYKAMVIINAIFASALYFPIYYIIRQLFSVDKKTTSIITFVTCLYPAFTVQSMVVWQDAVIFTFHATSIALFLYFLKKQNYLSLILFSSSVGFLYMMHARALPMLIISILFLLFLSIYRREIRNKLLLGSSIMIALFFLTKAINTYLIEMAWINKETYFSVSGLISRLYSWDGIKIFFIRSLGQLWYLFVASFGLFFLAFIFVWKNILQGLKSGLQKSTKDINFLTLVYLLLASVGIFFASVLIYALPDVTRPDQLIYGRYNEIFLAPFIALGLVSIFLKTNKRIYYFYFMVIVLALAFLLGFEKSMGFYVVPQHIIGLSFWLILFKQLSIFIISIFVLLMFLLMLCFFNKNFIKGIFVLFIIFGINFSVYYSSYSNLNNSYGLSNSLITSIRDLRVDNMYYATERSFVDCDNIDDIDFFVGYNFNNYQWQLPETKFHLFNSKLGEMPKSKYFIASTCWQPTVGLKAHIIKQDNLGIQAIWEILEKND